MYVLCAMLYVPVSNVHAICKFLCVLCCLYTCLLCMPLLGLGNDNVVEMAGHALAAFFAVSPVSYAEALFTARLLPGPVIECVPGPGMALAKRRRSRTVAGATRLGYIAS